MKVGHRAVGNIKLVLMLATAHKTVASGYIMCSVAQRLHGNLACGLSFAHNFAMILRIIYTTFVIVAATAVRVPFSQICAG
jgi:hypothetical protein